ncbi:MAG: hypothetical protein ACREGC_02455, partial [Minisyncoccia bacterium]
MLELIFRKYVASRRLPDFWFNALIFAALVVASIIWSTISGKDLNWDQLNYHFYLPYSLFGDRISKDFIPANGQSYLNPLPYVPFYWMVTHNWNSLLIASVLTALHSLNAVLGYFIAEKILPPTQQNSRLIAVLAAVLTFLSPVLLMEIGTTFADASTATLVLAAVLCGLHSDQTTLWWKNRSLIAGVLMGAAGALKLSNLVFGPACAVLLICMQTTYVSRVRAVVLLGAGAFLGFALMQMYWGWQLWREFGNPLFPNFGVFFPTDIFPKETAPLERFLPENILGALLVPFRMTQLRAWVYVENVAPDLRFAALAVVGVVGGGYLFSKRHLKDVPPLSLNARKFLALTGFFVVAFGLWQWTSGNGRYGLVVSLLCGPMLALTAQAVCKNTSAAIYLLSGVIALQILHLQN